VNLGERIMERIVELLRKLTRIAGISGFEEEAGAFVQEEFKKFSDEVRMDKMGCVIGLKRGEGKGRILLAAHLDEIGLMVTKIEKDGYLRFTKVGGSDVRTFLGQEVIVHGSRDLKGIIGCKPPHFQDKEELGKIVKIEDLFIDIGLPEEETKKVVKVGDVVSLSRELIELKNRTYASKALDNRASVTALISSLELLRKMHHQWDVYAVATVQEEFKDVGALASTFGIRPNIGLAIDVTLGEMLGVSESESFPLGKGPTIAVGPNIHPQIAEKLIDVAKREEIPYQIEPCAGPTWTDAASIQLVGEGVPTGLVSIPLRYLHTSVETLMVQDIERTAKLLATFISDLNGWELQPFK